jgi:DNA-binding transcriptional ArsR family regulator
MSSTLMERQRAASPAEMDRAVELFKVLSHPDRLRLACALGDGRVTTQKELVEEFGWPQSTAARHIAALRAAGLVAAERDGAEVRLRLGNPVALHLLDTVCDWVHQPADAGAASPSADSSS